MGAAATAVQETRKLPQTILMYPMTLVSQAAQLVMRMQQNVAELAIKGDETLESIFPPRDEQPMWATFDEDYADDAAGAADVRPSGEGRFALYTPPDETDADVPEPIKKAAKKAAAAQNAAQTPEKEAAPKQDEPPEIVDDLDYDGLTLAQLRARLQSLSVSELEALLAYEHAHGSRAPFQTLLANRITRASAK